MAAARQFGKRVEVSSRRSETSQVFANSDGTLAWEQSLLPQRVRRVDGSWAPVDTTLRLGSDGSVRPGATVVPTQFSAGGSGALARLGDGDRQLEVSWPGTLPKPVLSGDSATYHEVLPGVDLRVTATITGFSEVLVVKSRAAAAHPSLAKVRFGLSGKGVTTRKVDGGLQAVDRDGRVVFQSPTPLMWDSSASGGTSLGKAQGSSSSAADEATPRNAKISTMVVDHDATSMSVTPDRALLDAADTVYPVFVDPSWDSGLLANHWTSVWEKFPDSSFWQNNTAQVDAATYGGAGAGRTKDCPGCSTYRVRSLFEMALNTPARGRHLLHASFLIEQRHSWTCNPASDARLWVTGPISSGTKWTAQPTWYDDLTAQGPASHAYGKANGCPMDVGDVRFDVTHMVQRGFNDGWSSMTVGLKAIDENDINFWKRYNAASPKLVIYYNSVPGAPTAPETHGRGCTRGPNFPVLATDTPTFKAVVNDDAGDSETDLKAEFEIWAFRQWYGMFSWDKVTSLTDSQGHTAGTISQASAKIGSVTEDPRVLYAWRAKTLDPWSFTNPWTGAVSAGTDASGWAGATDGPPNWNPESPVFPPGMCGFAMDLIAPAAPTVTGDVYQQDAVNPRGSVGKTGTFTFSVAGLANSADTIGYDWWIADSAGTRAPVSAPASVTGGSVTVSFTPTVAGQHTLFARSKDKAQVSATNTTIQFVVASPTKEVGRWKLDEAAGATTLADTAPVPSQSQHPATLAGGGLGAPGRVVNDTGALALNGTSTNNAQAVSPADTNRSFSVSAWVKPADLSTFRTVVSQDGDHASAFQLQYSTSCTCWNFRMQHADSSSSGVTNASAAGKPVKPNVWAHVTGVYDAAAGTAKIYVNGALAGTAAAPPVPWKATGKLIIGRSRANDASAEHWTGGVADVRVWDRSLSDTEAAVQVTPLSVDNDARDNAGAWKFEDCMASPLWCPDSSGYAHDVMGLNGGVVQTDSGKIGKGLAFDGTGWAQTLDPVSGEPGPSLYTDQSFTVSAWVYLTDATHGNRTILSQDGTNFSGFYLKYDQGAGGKWSLHMEGDDDVATNLRFVATSSSTAQANTWTHLTGVFDAATGELRIYVNGVLSGTKTGATGWHANGPFTIGRSKWAGTLADSWVGSIDEVRIYAGAVPNTAQGTADIKTKLCGC